MGYTETLRQRADAIWRAQHEHPFVRGIGDGTLDVARFKHWVRQDYRFLIEYARLLAMATARAPDLDTMTRMAALTSETLNSEMALHRAYAGEFGIAKAELEAEPMSPTCRAYTDFLVRTASAGDFVELVAALLPCMWGFSDVGRRLHERGLPTDARYAAWIEMYASDEFADLAQWCRDLLDRLAEGLPPAGLARVEEAFVTSCRYEYLFWEMAWNLERWPI